jgi:hypothetical protein
MTRLAVGIAVAVLAFVAPQPSARADPAEIAKAYTLFDDCLAKAVAKQPKGRPVEPLLHDLFSDCSVELTRVDDLLQRSGKTKKEARDVRSIMGTSYGLPRAPSR